jgi:hypothetical protein
MSSTIQANIPVPFYASIASIPHPNFDEGRRGTSRFMFEPGAEAVFSLIGF